MSPTHSLKWLAGENFKTGSNGMDVALTKDIVREVCTSERASEAVGYPVVVDVLDSPESVVAAIRPMDRRAVREDAPSYSYFTVDAPTGAPVCEIEPAFRDACELWVQECKPNMPEIAAA